MEEDFFSAFEDAGSAVGMRVVCFQAYTNVEKLFSIPNLSQ